MKFNEDWWKSAGDYGVVPGKYEEVCVSFPEMAAMKFKTNDQVEDGYIDAIQNAQRRGSKEAYFEGEVLRYRWEIAHRLRNGWPPIEPIEAQKKNEELFDELNKEGVKTKKEHTDNRNYLIRISLEQIEIFKEQYDIEKFNQADEDSRDKFIIELKYWINKFESDIKLNRQDTSLKNKFLNFTETEAFQHQAQLETIKTLLPFLKSQLKNAELEKSRSGIPKLRKHAVIPLGTMTVGELKLRIAEQIPEFVEISQEEQYEYINKAQQKIAKLYNDAGKKEYLMDTTTLLSLQKQTKKENEEKYLLLMRQLETNLHDIENAPISTSQAEKLRLQKRNIDIKLSITEFQQWFRENGLDIPQYPSNKGGNDSTKEQVESNQEDTKQKVEIASKTIFVPEQDKDTHIANLQNKVVELLRYKKFKKLTLSDEEFRTIVDEHRKKNGKINYSELGIALGVKHPTAKSWCKSRGIE